MRLNESQIRALVRKILSEADVLPPGEVPASKQIHIFDFDDTLGLTKNANGVMLYKDGKPAHKSPEEVEQWLKKYGVNKDDMLSPKIKKIPSRDNAYAAYVSSGGLAKIQKNVPRNRQGATGQSTEDHAYQDGENLLIDFTPSSSTDVDTTAPIKQTVSRLKAANRAGAHTAIVTARSSEGTGVDFDGDKVKATNAADMKQWLAKFGAKPTDGIVGVTGKNKGEEILNRFVKGKKNPPEEIHFYDDLKKNTDEVTAAITNDAPDESLYVYGPGEFAHGEADPKKPTTKIQSKTQEDDDKSNEKNVTQKESKQSAHDAMIEQWARIAGIR